MRLPVVRIHLAQPLKSGHSATAVKLPFLKQARLPRVAPEAPDQKLVQGSESDLLDDHCFHELMDAVRAKDVKLFRQALEALVLNCFEEDKQDAA